MKNKSKGLSLLEVMIALFIFTLMVGSVFPIFMTSRVSNLSSKAFSNARQIAQSEIEHLYGYSQTLGYSDSLYQIITQEDFICTGFTWTTDLLTGDIIYSIPSNPVTCVKTINSFRINLVLSQNDTVDDPNLKNILLRVTSINVTPEIKRYETLYATKFKE